MQAIQSVHRDSSGKQYLNVMKAMWDIVDQHFDPIKVLTPQGHRLVQTYSLKAAHHELPYTMHFLAMLCSLANGAKTSWSPNSASPLFLMVLNVNYTQTRKSSLTGNGDEFGDHLDAVTRDVVASKAATEATEPPAPAEAQAPDGQELRSAHRRSRRGAGMEQPRIRPEVISSVVHSATPTEFSTAAQGISSR